MFAWFQGMDVKHFVALVVGIFGGASLGPYMPFLNIVHQILHGLGVAPVQ